MKNVAKMVGATSSEEFLALKIEYNKRLVDSVSFFTVDNVRMTHRSTCMATWKLVMTI